MLWREEEEKLPRERSPLFVSCSNLWKQKAGEEWSTRASWGPVPRRRQHREGGLAMPFSASCHRVPAPAVGSGRPRRASHTWARTGKQLTSNPNQTSTEALPPCSLHGWQSLHALPDSPPWAQGLLLTWSVPGNSGAPGDYRAGAPPD